jgi:[ribosomal protein S18]-alanine N-acetyltransferase
MAGVTVRRGEPGDLEAVARIQVLSPGASQWDPADYLAHDFTVAVCEGRVAGFVVARRVGEGESEVLNLAVEPAQRRRGIARLLLDEIKLQHRGAIFLEVRESNQNARRFYRSLGFQEITVRQGYYCNPPESAIVMKFHSC